jgi:hypothetical protein
VISSALRSGASALRWPLVAAPAATQHATRPTTAKRARACAREQRPCESALGEASLRGSCGRRQPSPHGPRACGGVLPSARPLVRGTRRVTCIQTDVYSSARLARAPALRAVWYALSKPERTCGARRLAEARAHGGELLLAPHGHAHRPHGLVRPARARTADPIDWVRPVNRRAVSFRGNAAGGAVCVGRRGRSYSVTCAVQACSMQRAALCVGAHATQACRTRHTR